MEELRELEEGVRRTLPGERIVEGSKRSFAGDEEPPTGEEGGKAVAEAIPRERPRIDAESEAAASLFVD